MSAPMHFKTVQQLADHVGVSRRLMFQAFNVRRYGCPELINAASDGSLAAKHCETLAKALSHDQQRELLAELPSMKPRARNDLLAIIRGDLMYRERMASEAKQGVSHD